MKFGAFGNLAVWRPWTEGFEARRYHEEIALGIAADKAGYDYYWAPEHHFQEEYSHCPNSDTLLTALAMVTSNIRLATGIMNICPPINHPVKVAERIAMIDILSNGRVDLGTGRGSGSLEVNGFGVTNEESRAMWSEALDAIPRMWQDDLFSWDGTYFKMPERTILPKPVQKPHPPLWVTGSNHSTATIAGEKGIGLAIFSFAEPEALVDPITAYRTAIANAKPVGGFVNNQVMSVQLSMCLEDGEKARQIYRDNFMWRIPYFSTYFDTVFPNTEPKPLTQTRYRELVEEAKKASNDESIGSFAFDPDMITQEFLRERAVPVGDPDDLIAAIKRYEEVGLDQLVLSPWTGPGEPHELTLESIANIGRDVLPAFR
jgi:alkanesulfonate monooxygenase SsuD/methylene tetrahydromethanopterin reductase-like flavin-dependent oxidoreductase (luciferase family)